MYNIDDVHSLHTTIIIMCFLCHPNLHPHLIYSLTGRCNLERAPALESVQPGVLFLLADMSGISHHMPSAYFWFLLRCVSSFICPHAPPQGHVWASLPGHSSLWILEFWGIKAAFNQRVTAVSVSKPPSPILWMDNSRRHSEHCSGSLVGL